MAAILTRYDLDNLLERERYLDTLAERRVFRDDLLAPLAPTLLARDVRWAGGWYEHREHLLTWATYRLVDLAHTVHQAERRAA